MNILLLSLTPQDPAQDHFWRNRQTLFALSSLDHTVDWIAPPLPPQFTLPPRVILHPLPRIFNFPLGINLFATTFAAQNPPKLIHAIDAAFPLISIPNIPLLTSSTVRPRRPCIPLLADLSTALPLRLNTADAIVTHSPHLLQRLRNRPSLAARTALLTPFPFAETSPLPTAVQRVRVNHLGDQDGLLFACAASPTPQTTLSILLKTLPEFSTGSAPSRLPAPFKFLLLTQNQHELTATRRLLKKHPCADSVTVLSPLLPDETQTLLAACDLLLAPSPDDPTSPGPPPRLTDFAFSGTPILATDIEPHCHELPPDCATFFPPNPRALLESLQRLLSNYDTALQRATRATEHLSLHHAPSLRAEELRLAYAYAQR